MTPLFYNIFHINIQGDFYETLQNLDVTNFRSIEDSTWIDCNNITNIIGVNEAGKSNALLALWKLHPARDGEINLLEDLPRNKYASLKRFM